MLQRFLQLISSAHYRSVKSKFKTFTKDPRRPCFVWARIHELYKIHRPIWKSGDFLQLFVGVTFSEFLDCCLKERPDVLIFSLEWTVTRKVISALIWLVRLPLIIWQISSGQNWWTVETAAPSPYISTAHHFNGTACLQRTCGWR